MARFLTEVTEGVDGVFAGGFDGGIDAKDEADDDGSGESDHEDIDVDVRVKRSNNRKKEGEDIAKGEATDAAEGREDEAFKEEFLEDVTGGCTDGFSDADFAGAFGDRDEHNIHDADAADDEGDAGHDGEHARDKTEEVRSRVRNVVAIHNREVFVALFDLGQLSFNLFREGSEGASVFGFDVDLLDLERDALGLQEVGVDENGVIEINVIIIDRVFFVVEETGDKESDAEGGESATDGILGTKEPEREIAADGGGVGLVVIRDEGAGFQA